jgi:hypothetical protein
MPPVLQRRELGVEREVGCGFTLNNRQACLPLLPLPGMAGH